jgi:energy-coupling factor transporter ATP-binding protein EcfA2
MSVLNKAGGESGRAPKLSEVLFERSSRSFGSLAPLPSNVEAVEAGLMFAAGLNTLVAVTGPSGWGKTHLLEAITYRLSHEHGTPIERVCASDLISSPTKAETSCHLVLDDVQEVLGRNRTQMSLRMTLERRVRFGRPTILAFTLPRATRQLKSFLPNYREWTIASMAEPQAEERVLLLNQMSFAEGLALSPSLTKVIAMSMYGNGRTLSGALKRLRLAGTSWLDSRATLRACGLLDPFFADNPEWDLKLRILKTAESNRAAFPKASTTDLALVAMLNEAELGEAEVARCLNISPAETYQRAARFQQQATTDPAMTGYVCRLVEMVVESLQ